MRHHLATDNVRLREALAIIADIGEGGNSIASLRNCARIARNALVSAAPANPNLHHPVKHTEGVTRDDKQ
jgi:hypothetical protein